MARSTPEWVGKSDDTAVPPRVRLRVWQRDGMLCKGCTRSLTAEIFATDHIIALISGGENRESNLQTLCMWCHSAKTKADVGMKSRDRRKQMHHLGIKARRGQPMAGTKASGLKKKFDGTVERRS